MMPASGPQTVLRDREVGRQGHRPGQPRHHLHQLLRHQGQQARGLHQVRSRAARTCRVAPAWAGVIRHSGLRRAQTRRARRRRPRAPPPGAISPDERGNLGPALLPAGPGVTVGLMNSPDAGGDAGQGADAGPGDGLVAGARIRQLADEQAALRRVATLVASGARPADVFAAAAEEIRWLFGADNAGIGRYERAGSSLWSSARSGRTRSHRRSGRGLNSSATCPRRWCGGPAAPPGSTTTGGAVSPDPVADDLRKLGVKSIVASPIIVEDRLWGVVTVVTRQGRFPVRHRRPHERLHGAGGHGDRQRPGRAGSAPADRYPVGAAASGHAGRPG